MTTTIPETNYGIVLPSLVAEPMMIQLMMQKYERWNWELDQLKKSSAILDELEIERLNRLKDVTQSMRSILEYMGVKIPKRMDGTAYQQAA